MYETVINLPILSFMGPKFYVKFGKVFPYSEIVLKIMLCFLPLFYGFIFYI